jgi:hypothetical protein
MKNPSPTPSPVGLTAGGLDPVGPSSQTQTPESSVVFSLAELTKLQLARLDEAARDAAARQEAAKLAEAKKKDDEARRRAEDDARRARTEEMRRLDDAQIEAAKKAEIEHRALEQRHRLELARLQAENAHAREMAALAETKRPRGVSTSVIAGLLAVTAALVIGALIWIVAVMPKRQDEAIRQLSQQEQSVAAEHASVDAAHRKSLDDLQHQLDELKKTMQDAATKTKIETAPTTKIKTVPTTHVGPTTTSTTSTGCDIEVAGVPMCSKSPAPK